MSLYDRILGLPIVYDHIRPAFLGGLDMSPVYDRLDARPTDVVLDVGCGTGIALEYLTKFGRYVGVDADPVAIEGAKRKPRAAEPNVEFRHQLLTRREVAEIKPDVVVFGSLLHHLDDATAVDLYRTVATSPRLRRVVSLDITFVPDHTFNNILTVLDRGQYPRRPSGYVALAKEAGMNVREEVLVPNKKGGQRIKYFVMVAEPPAAS